MPSWTVQVAQDQDERVEAGMLLTESGALIAFSEDGVVLRAWAPGQWRTVRALEVVHALQGGADSTNDVLTWMPRG